MCFFRSPWPRASRTSSMPFEWFTVFHNITIHPREWLHSSSKYVFLWGFWQLGTWVWINEKCLSNVDVKCARLQIRWWQHAEPILLTTGPVECGTRTHRTSLRRYRWLFEHGHHTTVKQNIKIIQCFQLIFCLFTRVSRTVSACIGSISPASTRRGNRPWGGLGKSLSKCRRCTYLASLKGFAKDWKRCVSLLCYLSELQIPSPYFDPESLLLTSSLSR